MGSTRLNTNKVKLSNLNPQLSHAIQQVKTSALIIVCNGEPFIGIQLANLYDCVDEIIIVEGADRWFEKVIGSKRSTDGTIQTIKDYPDPDKKIVLKHVNVGKNRMVRIGNELCTGDLIYQVDVDEFMKPEHIALGFKMLRDNPTKDHVMVPQRWYYKWNDTFLAYKNSKLNYTRMDPGRFYRNRIKDGKWISHIPFWGYYMVKNGKNKFWCRDGNPKITLPEGYAYHYLCLYKFQIENKMKYYIARDKARPTILKTKLDEFVGYNRKDCGEEALGKKSFKKKIVSYQTGLLIDPNPFLSHKPRMSLR